MSYDNSGSLTCTVTVNPASVTSADVLTIAWYDDIELKRYLFDVFANFYKFMTQAQIETLLGNGYGDYGPGQHSTGNRTLVQISDDFTLDASSYTAYSSVMPEIHAVCNPMIYKLHFPLMPNTKSSYPVDMTEYITTDAAVTAVNFGSSSVTTDDFIQTMEHRFRLSAQTISITSDIGTVTENALFFNPDIYENGFRFDLQSNGIVYDVDQLNSAANCYGARYTDDVIWFRARIERQGLGGQTYLDRSDKYSKIPFVPSASLSATISQQEKYLYHESEKDQYFLLDLKKYALNGDRYINSYFFIPANGLTWAQMTTWYNNSPTKVPIYATGRKASSTGKLYRAGKISSINATSDDEITIRVKAPTGTFKLQSAGYQSTITGETQTGKKLLSVNGDILKENKAVTIS